jgi:hypothetical protein
MQIERADAGGQQPWIIRTGQRRKALVTLVVACLAPAAAVLSFSFGGSTIAFVLLGIALLSFIAFATTIRCPKCHKSISFMVLASRPSSQWLHDLFGLEECPACHDEAIPAG